MNGEQLSHWVSVTSLVITLGAWAVFAIPLIQRSRLKTAGIRNREPLSWLGLGLQFEGYAIPFFGQRPHLFSPIVENRTLNIIVQIAAISLAVFSAWFAVSAIRELGKQWSLQARVLEDHKLVTTGVYGVVRHPIYTAMLGMLVATGLVFNGWLPIGAGLVVFLSGTLIRIRLEERLLVGAFGEEFSAWKNRVPAIIPGLKI